MNGENTEIYYAEMEAARNEAEDAYFNARPQLADTIYARTLFREGFQRGFRMAWERRDRGDDPDDDGPCPDRRCTGF